MRALFDVNALLAMVDTAHVHHERVRSWLHGHHASGWATCAITQNGFARIMSQPRYPNSVPPHLALDMLAEATRGKQHQFWPCAVSVSDPAVIRRSMVLGPKQITDLYLLALAVANGGRFATLDGSVSRNAVLGANEDHLVQL